MTCKDCGFYDEPIYKVVPYAELTFVQRLRVRLAKSGVYLRDQFNDVYFDSGIDSPDYRD